MLSVIIIFRALHKLNEWKVRGRVGVVPISFWEFSRYEAFYESRACVRTYFVRVMHKKNIFDIFAMTINFVTWSESPRATKYRYRNLAGMVQTRTIIKRIAPATSHTSHTGFSRIYLWKIDFQMRWPKLEPRVDTMNLFLMGLFFMGLP